MATHTLTGHLQTLSSVQISILSPSSQSPDPCNTLRTSEPTQPLDALRNCLEYINKVLQGRDDHSFFSYPIDERIAPNYFAIIEKPMDFAQMTEKIEETEYENVSAYKADFNLMCQNAMRYNAPETVYFTEGGFQVQEEMSIE
jgi:hypothetical protein